MNCRVHFLHYIPRVHGNIFVAIVACGGLHVDSKFSLSAGSNKNKINWGIQARGSDREAGAVSTLGGPFPNFKAFLKPGFISDESQEMESVSILRHRGNGV